MDRRTSLPRFLTLVLFAVVLLLCAATTASARTIYLEDEDDGDTFSCDAGDTVTFEVDVSSDEYVKWRASGDADSFDDDDETLTVYTDSEGSITIKADFYDEDDDVFLRRITVYLEVEEDSDDGWIEFDEDDIYLDVGEKVTLDPDYDSDYDLEFKSTNTSIAKVGSSSGVVTGVRRGSCTIRAWCGDDYDSITVHVSDDSDDDLSLNYTSITLRPGEERRIKVTEDDLSNSDVRWSSGSTSIAKVDSDGYVTAQKAGTTYITATLRRNSNVKARCKVTVSSSANSGTIEYSVTQNGQLQFDLSKFNSFSQDICKSDISEIRFTDLPSTSRGTLYYRYDSASDKKRVTTSDTYYTSGREIISDLTFLPAVDFTGRVTYDFTGHSKSGRTLSGTVRIDVEAAKGASTLAYSTSGTLPARFKSADFERACSARGSASLSYVRFTLPDSRTGALYYDYLSPLSSAKKVDESIDYGLSGSYLIDKISFVPAPGTGGTVTIGYTGADKSGSSYRGTILIYVTDTMANVSKFSDVDRNDYYAQPVSWAIDRGITKGTSASSFSPEATCTKIQILTFLWRANGSPAAAASSFTDLPSNQDYRSAAAWASEKGLVSGTLLSPDAPCTRAEVAKYLWILAGRPAASNTRFTDVPASADYAAAVAWAVQQGVTNGTSSSTFSPSATCKRGEITAFLWRAIGHRS